MRNGKKMENPASSTVSVQWKVSLPFIWYVIPPAVYIVLLAMVYFVFMSMSVLVHEAVILFVVIFTGIVIARFLHPMRFGKWSYTKGQLAIYPTYFGIKPDNGVRYAFFNTAKAVVDLRQERSVKISRLCAVTVHDGIPVAETEWKCWKPSISVRFGNDIDLNSFLEAKRRSATA